MGGQQSRLEISNSFDDDVCNPAPEDRTVLAYATQPQQRSWATQTTPPPNTGFEEDQDLTDYEDEPEPTPTEIQLLARVAQLEELVANYRDVRAVRRRDPDFAWREMNWAMFRLHNAMRTIEALERAAVARGHFRVGSPRGLPIDSPVYRQSPAHHTDWTDNPQRTPERRRHSNPHHEPIRHTPRDRRAATSDRGTPPPIPIAARDDFTDGDLEESGHQESAQQTPVPTTSGGLQQDEAPRASRGLIMQTHRRGSRYQGLGSRDAWTPVHRVQDANTSARPSRAAIQSRRRRRGQASRDSAYTPEQEQALLGAGVRGSPRDTAPSDRVTRSVARETGFELPDVWENSPTRQRHTAKSKARVSKNRKQK